MSHLTSPTEAEDLDFSNEAMTHPVRKVGVLVRPGEPRWQVRRVTSRGIVNVTRPLSSYNLAAKLAKKGDFIDVI